jgi:IclR family acetate operon transcriptional repressor
LRILKVLAQSPQGLTFSELHRKVNIPKSSLFGLLSTIQYEQWINFDKASKRYSLGIEAWESTQTYMNQNRLILIAESHIAEMTADLHAAGHLAILSGKEVLYLAQIKPDSSYDLPSRVGVRLPAQATALGKSLLSGFSETDVVNLFKDHPFIKYNEQTTDSLNALLADVARVKKLGYSESNGEIVENVYCVAAPIQDSKRNVVAAISSTVSMETLAQKKLMKPMLREYVKTQAAEISKELRTAL